MAVLLLWLAPRSAFPQESGVPTPATQRVLVTAELPSALSASAEEAKARLQPVPAAVNVYTADGYSLGRGDYLEDLLRYQPGLVIASSQGAEDIHVSSRGSGQDNDDIIGLAILIDGIPIIEDFRREYNQCQPHGELAYQSPACFAPLHRQHNLASFQKAGQSHPTQLHANQPVD